MIQHSCPPSSSRSGTNEPVGLEFPRVRGRGTGAAKPRAAGGFAAPPASAGTPAGGSRSGDVELPGVGVADSLNGLNGSVHFGSRTWWRRGRGLIGWIRSCLGLAGVLVGAPIAAEAADPDLADLFAHRGLASGKSGSARGSTVDATLEAREPRHGGKPGGHSVWISWTAPSTGIATFDTAGSDFDTLLSAYVLETRDPAKPAMERLREVARSDDNDGGLGAVVQFGVQEGTTYEVAVDGFNGATGEARLRWDLLASDQPLPVILQVPPDRALRVGDAVSLTVDYQAGEDVKLAWLFNGDDVLGAETGTLTLPDFQRANVGRYQLRLTAGQVRFTSAPIELQVNSEGEISVLARDKLLDALGTPLIGRGAVPALAAAAPTPGAGVASRRAPAAIGVTRGYNGVQIFNTQYAGREAGEPAHCGQGGGASYWLAYVAPAAGTLSLDTEGSSFDTVLAVYTYEEPLLGYPSLIPVACDDNGGPGGGASLLRFTTQPGRTYLVVIDGVAGARGTAHLNYRLQATPPVIARSPEGLAVNAGQEAVFAVEATGSEPLTFQWTKDGTAIEGATARTLSLPSVTAAEAGSYAVRVSNAAGTATSEAAVLVVRIPPVIARSPEGLVVNAGQEAVFAVEATGSEPLTFQWTKDGTAIDGATARTLSLPSVTAVEAGSYAVRVSNAAGTATSEAAVLVVRIPPVIARSPEGLAVNAGQEAVFAVEATGSEPLTFQWTKDGTAIEGATARTLSVPSVTAVEAGSYAVRVSNAAGTATSGAAVLVVRIPPVIARSPEGLAVNAGQEAVFAVEATGSEPLTFQWTKDGTAIEGATARTLSLPSVTAAEAGSYAVRVSNAAGTVTSGAAVLVVRIPPVIARSPEGLAVNAGQEAVFAVEATGSEPLTFQWTKDGTAIEGATARTLSLPSVTAAEAGSYAVRVSNAAGTATSGAAVLVVRIPPVIARSPEGLVVNAGQEAVFAVEATGSEPLTFQWTKDGTAIEGATARTLSLPSVTAAEAGSYAVRVSNAAGTATSEAAVLVVRIPPVIARSPEGLVVNAGQEAVFAVEATGSEPLTFQWTKDGTAIEGATGRTLSLPSVTAAEAGSYAVRVSNAAGTATSGAAVLVVRIPPVIARSPEGLVVNAGQEAVFAVEATGSEPLTFQWTKDGTAIEGATARTLSLPSVTAAEAGSYAVRVSNAAGTATSVAAVLVVRVSARIIREPGASEVVFQLPSAPGLPYRLEVADALAGAGWTAVEVGVAVGAVVEVRRSIDPAGSRFYRFTVPAGSGSAGWLSRGRTVLWPQGSPPSTP
jgi:hypothetical protein